MRSDVIIVGAGVLGLSLAYQLGKRKQSVIVLERESSFATHASGKNAGMIRQFYAHPQLSEWAERSRQLWPEGFRQTVFKQTGSWIVGRRMPSHHQHLFKEDKIKQVIDGKAYEQVAIYTATDGLIHPPLYVKILFQLSDQQYVRYSFDQEVIAVSHHRSEWEIECKNGARFQAPWFVNAAGATLNDFLVPTHSELRVAAEPFARHLFVVSGWQENFMPAPHCGFYWEENLGWYMRLWNNNSWLVSICDKTPADPKTFVPDPIIAGRVLSKLKVSLPDSADVHVKDSWYCFRTYTEDQLPVWGEDPLAKGLFWLGAFGGFGMSTSFAATYDAAEYIVGNQTSVSRDFFPERVRADLSSR